jgi:HEAT repeat protein
VLSEIRIRERAWDALMNVLESSLEQESLSDPQDQALARASALALARIVRATKGGFPALESRVQSMLSRTDLPAIQETALLCLGITESPGCSSLLKAVLLDAPSGQEALGSAAVGVRNRAFAAFALGLLSRDTSCDELRLENVDALLRALGNKDTATPEIQVACLLAVGLVPLPFCTDGRLSPSQFLMEGSRHLCGAVQLAHLMEIFQSEAQDLILRAHVAPGLGRLGRVAPSELRAEILEAFERELRRPADEHGPLQAGCIIGLGLLAKGQADEVAKRARRSLSRCVRSEDPAASGLAMMALAQSSPEVANALALLRRRLDQGDPDVGPWAAVALGVLDYNSTCVDRWLSEAIERRLRVAIAHAENREQVNAAMLACTVVGGQEAVATVLKRLKQSDDDDLRGTAALYLGVLGAEGAGAPLRCWLADAADSPQAFKSIAVALRLLGDGAVGSDVLEWIEEAKDVEQRAFMVGALGDLQDPVCVEALFEILGDCCEATTVRASAATALGDLCDGTGPSWTSTYSSDLNFLLLTWTLASPFDDGTGLLDLR